jgi:hypothetical protein
VLILNREDLIQDGVAFVGQLRHLRQNPCVGESVESGARAVNACLLHAIDEHVGLDGKRVLAQPFRYLVDVTGQLLRVR